MFAIIKLFFLSILVLLTYVIFKNVFSWKELILIGVFSLFFLSHLNSRNIDFLQ